ncbi:unnamed protein product [Rhizophagus irregularis]|nr:unnamed protein product [Rhizophagus irregularis]CAB5390944.1 unnamed protein product [Rhizophagus irregularis]
MPAKLFQVVFSVRRWHFFPFTVGSASLPRVMRDGARTPYDLMSFMSSNCATQELSGHFRRFGTDGTVPGRYYEEEREVGMRIKY